MEDKTTKIPSLKEFNAPEKSKKNYGKNSSKAPLLKKNSLKEQTHRIELGKEKATPGKAGGSSRNKSVKRAKPSNTTRKPENIGEYSYEDRFKAFESDVSYKRRRPPSDKFKASGGSKVSAMPRDGKPYGKPPVTHSGRGQGKAYAQNLKNPREIGKYKASKGKSIKRKKARKPLSPFARKVRRVLAYSLIVLGVLAVGIVLCMTVLFKTENIVVNVPNGFYSSEEIISASGLNMGVNIFTAGKSSAEKRLEEKFPYIKSADIYAVMPNTINIDITLSTPSYAVKTENVTYIANEDSKVLEVVATDDEVNVAVIEGVEVNGAKAGEKLNFESAIVRESLSEMFNLAKTNGYKKITRVNIETETTQTGKKTVEIRYVYDDRIVVYLGLPENISYKMLTAQTIISEKLDANGEVLTGELDVSNAYDTKKSYFNQYSLIPEAVITEPSTQASETDTTAAYEDY